MPTPEQTAIPEQTALERCHFQQGELTCAFLAMSGGLCCAKNTDIEGNIRERLAEGSMKTKGDYCDGNGGPVVFTCRALCQNIGTCCVVCFQGDMANCRFDPECAVGCRSRCTNPNGPCPEGETLYDKVSGASEV